MTAYPDNFSTDTGGDFFLISTFRTFALELQRTLKDNCYRSRTQRGIVLLV